MGIYEYMSGRVADLTPASLVIEQQGVGYLIQISLQTYTQLRGQKEVRVWIEEVIREDAHHLFGFAQHEERELFRLLMGVTGIGANTARMMLSSLTTPEIRRAIQTENINLLKSIKGIGLKTAQRVVIDLRDKMLMKGDVSEIMRGTDNTPREEALSALVMLGFSKNDCVKVLNALSGEFPDHSAEQLVKLALKKL